MRLNLPATTAELADLRAGDELQLYGTIYTMRDAGHTRALEYLRANGELPYGLAGQALFYAGPTEPAAGRPFGAIGPTTSARMDFATPAFLHAGITLTLGKGPRSAEVATACLQTGSVYLAATGGAAALLATYVTASELVAWPELGTEALRRLTINGLPAFCALDAWGGNLYELEEQATKTDSAVESARADDAAAVSVGGVANTTAAFAVDRGTKAKERQ